MKKKTKNNNIPIIEVLLQKLSMQNKYGIHLPIREAEYKKQMDMYDHLVAKKLISDKFYKARAEELFSKTLDNDTYDLFCKCVLQEYSQK